MKLKIFGVMLMAAVLLLAGCASKGYVDKQVTAAQAQNEAQINELKAKAALNADDIKKLQTLSNQLETKTELALNEAKGFENYQVIWEGVINFDFDSFELTQVAKEKLEELGTKMIDHPRSLLEIEGHTDKSGSAKYNLELGRKRSEAAKKFMIDQYGIALYRMFTASHGSTKPVAMPDEKNAFTKNRRVVMKLWGQL